MALDFFAGCLGGCAGVIVGHPLDTVKVHLQTQDSQNPKYRGTLHCIRTLVVRDGVRGLYRGVTSPLAGIAAINAVIFGVYGNANRRLRDPTTISSHVIAGATAGFCQSFLTSPVELAKTRAQVSGRDVGPIRILKEVYASEGARGVFRGLNVTIAREVPAFSSYFVSYELLTRTADGSPASTWAMLISGGVAGVVSWAVSYPMDVIKTRIQVDGIDGRFAYKSTFDCLKKSVAAEGYGILFRGLAPTVVRAFPVNAACFTVVTWTMRLLDDSIVNVDTVGPDKTMWEKYSDVVCNIHNPETVPA